MSIYSTVASSVESAAKANGYSIDLGAKSARVASSRAASSSRSHHSQGYGSMADGEELSREQMGAAGN
jgi:hypothetical protein